MAVVMDSLQQRSSTFALLLKTPPSTQVSDLLTADENLIFIPERVASLEVRVDDLEEVVLKGLLK